MASSIFTLMAMSIDRYVSIQFPTSKRRVKKFSEAIVMIVLIWVVSAAIMTPLLLVREVDEIPLPHFESLGFCVEKWVNHDYRLAFGISSLLVVFIIPATILAICYVRIGETLCNKQFERVNSNSSAQTITSRKRAARMLVILVVLFLVFWLPYNITSLALDISGELSQIAVLRYALWLGHAHSAVNPVMYWCLNKRLREAVNSLWPTCCRELVQERKPTPPPVRYGHSFHYSSIIKVFIHMMFYIYNRLLLF